MPEPDPFTKAVLCISTGVKIPLRDYALAYLRHHDVLQESSSKDDVPRQLAYDLMSKALKLTINKVRLCLPQFRKIFYQCMVELVRRRGVRREALRWAPYWVRLLEEKLNVLPRALEEVTVQRGRKSVDARRQLTPSGALRLMVAYCARHRALCSSALYAELRLALRCGAAVGSLHAVWVSAQRVFMRQLAAWCRAGDAPAKDPRAPLPPLTAAAWRVVDLVLTYTDVDAHRVLTDESVTLYDELQALTTLFTLVQKHRVEEGGGGERLARAWTALYREYTAGGKRTSAVVLQRRWHELKLQARARLQPYWRARRPPPARLPPDRHPPALLHLDIVKKFPHVVLRPPVSWRQLVAQGLVFQAPREQESSPREDSAQEDSDEGGARGPPARDDRDDDVLLIEKQVETIDVDSASDDERGGRGTDVVARDEPRPSAAAPVLEQHIIAPSVVRQLINVASVESINSRFQESISGRSLSSEGTSAASTDGATPAASAGPSDAGQTLAILQTLDPTKVRAEIIFESDSDDEPLRSDTRNTVRETRVNIGDVISRAIDRLTDNVQNINYNSNIVPDTSMSDVTSDVLRQFRAPDAGNITIDSVSLLQKLLTNKNITTKAKDVSETYSNTRLNSGTEDVTMHDAAATAIAANSGSGYNTAMADVGSQSGSDVIINSETGSTVYSVTGAALAAAPTFDGAVVKVEVSSDNGAVNNDIDNDSSAAASAPRGSESAQHEKDAQECLVDPKLIMDTRVELMRIHDTAAWRRHSQRDRYINVHRLDAAQFTPRTKSDERVLIEIEINGIAGAGPTPAEDSAAERHDISTECPPAAAADVSDDGPSSGDDWLERYVAATDARRKKYTGRGVKRSIASAACQWSDDYHRLFTGGAGGAGGAGGGGRARRSERAAKRVRLPDIEEVRRVNSNILTAQVAPITAPSTVESEEFPPAAERGGDKRADLLVRSVGAASPAPGAGGAGGAGSGAGGAAPGAGGDRPDEVVPTSRELGVVLDKLTAELRRRALAVGLPAPGYCCAARRHRSVNDARRRICPRAPEIPLHEHGAAPCACCCRHLVRGAETRARLGGDVARLRRDLRRLLLAAPVSDGSTERDGGGSKRAQGPVSSKKSKKKSRRPRPPAAEPEDPPDDDPLAEWERQKNLTARFFRIDALAAAGQRPPARRPPAAAAGGGRREPGPAVGARRGGPPIEIAVRSGGPAPAIVRIGKSATAGPSAVARSATGSPPKHFSLIVTDLKEPVHDFRKIVKLHSKPNSAPRSATSTPAGATASNDSNVPAGGPSAGPSGGPGADARPGRSASVTSVGAVPSTVASVVASTLANPAAILVASILANPAPNFVASPAANIVATTGKSLPDNVVASTGKSLADNVVASPGKSPVFNVVASTGKSFADNVVASTGMSPADNVMVSTGMSTADNVVASPGKSLADNVVASTAKSPVFDVVASTGMTPADNVVASTGKSLTDNVVASTGKSLADNVVASPATSIVVSMGASSAARVEASTAASSAASVAATPVVGPADVTGGEST